ncbi:ubiquinol-cytochrome-c reductase complex assembly factor 3 [Bubalus kerabau]|uniref:ubiquinol-cytochrome-c reductase complex assembly factor 3 n=2 Tax=Bubalus TaxID=9918 RepID=UPI00042D0718|nr:ubiquinol-cytochrome-c reductase complex assembly factor 3 [Bubalus carabanensis]
MVSCVGRSSLRRLSRRGGPDRLLEAPEVVSLVARSTMETLRKLLLAGAMLGAGAGVGTALFALVTPGEERKQAMLKEMPEQDPQRRDEAARTKELLLATLQEAAATQENVAWRKNWMSGGGGGRSA